MLFGFAVWDAHRVSISLLSSPVGLIWSLNLQSKAGHIGQVRRACAVWQLSDGGASRHDTAKQAASKSLCFPSFSGLGIRIKSLLPAVLLPWENRQPSHRTWFSDDGAPPCIWFGLMSVWKLQLQSNQSCDSSVGYSQWVEWLTGLYWPHLAMLCLMVLCQREDGITVALVCSLRCAPS